MDLKISVVVPIRNRMPVSERVLRSLINQEQLIFELVIVDDASTPSVAECLFDIIQIAIKKGIQVIQIRNASNHGVSASRNIGASASTGDLICFCDSDDYWIPQKTAELLRLFKNKNVNVLYHSFNWCYDTLAIFKLLPRGKLFKLPRALIVAFSFLNPSCLSLRREFYCQGFDEKLHYHEDLDFALRLSASEPIYLFSYPFTIMSRPPGTLGGASANEAEMRRGAIVALSKVDGNVGIRFLSTLKILFHKFKLDRL